MILKSRACRGLRFDAPKSSLCLGGLVTEIGYVKISAQKKYEDDIVSVGRLEVVNLDG